MSESKTIEVEKYLTQMRDMASLAKELNVSRDYIIAMKREGFVMPGGKASIRMGRDFLATCVEFHVRTKTPKS